MPGVLMLESLSQVAAMLLLQRDDAPPNARVYLRGVNDAKFRRQVVPGDRLRLEVTLGRRRDDAGARAGGGLSSATRSSPKPSCCSASCPIETEIDPTAIVHPRAQIGDGTTIGAARDRSAPNVRIGAQLPHRRVGASSTAGPRSATTPRSIRSPRSA